MFSKDYELDLSVVKDINSKRKSFGIDRFPIGFWTHGGVQLPRDIEHFTPDCVDMWKDGGITVAHTPSFNVDDSESVEAVKKILIRANELQIKVVLVPEFDRWATMELVEKEYPQIITKLYDTFKDYPAVFGMYALDEPHSPERHQVATRMVRLQKQLAPKWVPFFNLLPFWEPCDEEKCWENQGFDSYSASLDDFIKSGDADYISYDLYHPMKFGEQGFTNHFNCLRYYREASIRNRIPFMNILLSVGHFNYRCPNYDELRWQVMTSLAYGISGFLWYYLYQGVHCINYRFAPIDELWEKTETWYNIRKIHRELLDTYGDTFSKIVCYRTEFYGRGYGTDPTFRPNNMVLSIKADIMHHPLVVSYFVDEIGDKYVMIVNNTTDRDGSTKLHVSFPKDVELMFFENGAPQKWGYICDNYWIENDRQYCQFWLAPGQEAFIKLVSEDIRNTPAYIPPMVY